MTLNDAASIVYSGHHPASWLYNVVTKLERQITALDAQGADTTLLRQHLQTVQGAIDADKQP
jgi:hypothetical protein